MKQSVLSPVFHASSSGILRTAFVLSLVSAAIFGSMFDSAPLAAEASRDELALPATDDGLPGAGPIRRYDWFEKLWLNRRTDFAENAAQEKGSVVFLAIRLLRDGAVGWLGHSPNSNPRTEESVVIPRVEC
ncbi:MAG: hypothetical protein R3C20_06130 [Planctomycetaceae bacterium]